MATRSKQSATNSPQALSLNETANSKMNALIGHHCLLQWRSGRWTKKRVPKHVSRYGGQATIAMLRPSVCESWIDKPTGCWVEDSTLANPVESGRRNKMGKIMMTYTDNGFRDLRRRNGILADLDKTTISDAPNLPNLKLLGFFIVSAHKSSLLF